MARVVELVSPSEFEMVGETSQDRGEGCRKRWRCLKCVHRRKACDVRCTLLGKVTEGVVELQLCSIAVAQQPYSQSQLVKTKH